MSQPMPQDHQAQYFAQTPVYVLTRSGAGGMVQVIGDDTLAGPAVACYLSPVHAIIETVYWTLCGEKYEVTPADQIDRKAFRTAEGTGLMASLRLAWPVLDGRLLLRPDGGLASVSMTMAQCTATPQPPGAFEVDASVLARVDGLYERAGLYAWRETHHDVLDWDAMRLAKMARRAACEMQTIEGDPSQCREAALFDPEFGQWHVVPMVGVKV